jgi:FkbM family methyltransferase
VTPIEESPQTEPAISVLHVLPLIAPRAGGYVTFALQACVALEPHGIHPIIYATDLAHLPMARDPARMSVADAPYGADRLDVRLGHASPPRRFANSWQMWRELPSLVGTVDLVHIHSLWLAPQLAGYLSCRLTNVPYVVSPHGALDPYLRLKGRRRKWIIDRVWQRQMLRDAAALHVTTSDERDLVADIAPAVPRFIAPVGIHVDDYTDLPNPSGFRDEHLGGHAGPVVLFLGRITFKKALDVLLRGFASALPDHQDTLLVIVGPDDEGLSPSLRRLAGQLGIADHVRLVPALYGTEKLAALAAANVWILASHTENFGVSALEAAAAGLPIILSPQVNIAAEMLAAGAAVVAAVEPEAVGVAIGELLDDAPRRRRCGAAARTFAASYDWSRIAPALAEDYRQVLSSATTDGAAPSPLTERLRKARKLIRLLRTTSYRAALRHGVAATIEHERVPFGHEFRSVIDVGAHQGQFAVFASTRFPRAALWAIEPLPEPRARLERVFKGRSGLTVIAAAASRLRGNAAFHVAQASDSSSLLEMTPANRRAFGHADGGGVIEVWTAPLDELLDGVVLARPCLLKIDVQGTELDVLAGAEITLLSVDEALIECSFLELYRGQALADDVVSHMRSRGFVVSGIHSLVRDTAGRRLQADFLFRRSEAT